MTTADHVLDQIDNALEDWSVSDDAMRSRPHDDDADRAHFPGVTPNLHVMDEAGEWHQVEGVGIIELRIDPSAAIEQLQRLRQAFEAARPHIEERFRQTTRAFDSLKQAGVCDDHGQPLPPPDRPAWQSRYGPAHQRRRRR